MCMNCTDVNAVGEFFFSSLKIYFVILQSFSSFRFFFQWAVIFLYFVPVNFLQFMLGLDVGCLISGVLFVASLIGLEAL